MTPYHTGAKIKDTVNEALIYAIREDRDVITWKDIVKARQLKELGPPEDVEYIERERHAVAVHEACHAVLAWLTRRHMEIDLATIEKGSSYLGMVSSIPPEDQFTQWRTEYESDILVSLASLAGERLFYGGDNSSGVSGDLTTATTIAGLMESHWGMGTGALVAARAAAPRHHRRRPGGEAEAAAAASASALPLPSSASRARAVPSGSGSSRTWPGCCSRAEELLQENRLQVLALAHALEPHKTLSGEDVVAVLEGRRRSARGRPSLRRPGVPAGARELPRRRRGGPPRARPARHAAPRAPAARGRLAGEVVEVDGRQPPRPVRPAGATRRRAGGASSPGTPAATARSDAGVRRADRGSAVGPGPHAGVVAGLDRRGRRRARPQPSARFCSSTARRVAQARPGDRAARRRRRRP